MSILRDITFGSQITCQAVYTFKGKTHGNRRSLRYYISPPPVNSPIYNAGEISHSIGEISHYIMSRKSKDDYIAIFSYLTDLLPSTNVTTVVIDFESAVWGAHLSSPEAVPSIGPRGYTITSKT